MKTKICRNFENDQEIEFLKKFPKKFCHPKNFRQKFNILSSSFFFVNILILIVLIDSSKKYWDIGGHIGHFRKLGIFSDF